MKMKKVLSLLLAGAMVLGMTACGSSGDTADGGDSSDSGDGSKTIEILWPETDSTQVDVMENYIQPALAENFPDITFEYTPMTNAVGDSPIKTMSAAGDLPEIYFTGGADVDAILGAGDALDMSEYLEKDDWVEKNFETTEYVYSGDAIYFLPVGQNAYYSPVIYYNKAVFNENGIAEPTNMDEFVAACQKLVDAGITPITMAQWVSSYSLLDGIISSASPEAFEELSQRKCDWTDPRVKDALKYFDDLKLMGAFAPDIVNKDDATAYSEFQSGSAAMILTYSWFNGDMVEEKLGFEAGSFSFPNASDDYIQLIFEGRPGRGGGYTVNANVDDPELFAEIMKVMVQAEAERHNKNGVKTNFIVENPAVAANDFEARRYEDYDRAAKQISVLEQGQMDGPTIAEFTTLYNMLLSDDKGYLSENFIEEFEPIWEACSFANE